jgi:hypothetical protein
MDVKDIVATASEAGLEQLIRLAQDRLNDLRRAQVTDDELQLIASNRKNDAIKAVRARLNCSLKTAVDIVSTTRI